MKYAGPSGKHLKRSIEQAHPRGSMSGMTALTMFLQSYCPACHAGNMSYWANTTHNHKHHRYEYRKHCWACHTTWAQYEHYWGERNGVPQTELTVEEVPGACTDCEDFVGHEGRRNHLDWKVQCGCRICNPKPKTTKQVKKLEQRPKGRTRVRLRNANPNGYRTEQALKSYYWDECLECGGVLDDHVSSWGQGKHCRKCHKTWSREFFYAPDRWGGKSYEEEVIERQTDRECPGCQLHAMGATKETLRDVIGLVRWTERDEAHMRSLWERGKSAFWLDPDLWKRTPTDVDGRPNSPCWMHLVDTDAPKAKVIKAANDQAEEAATPHYVVEERTRQVTWQRLPGGHAYRDTLCMVCDLKACVCWIPVIKKWELKGDHYSDARRCLDCGDGHTPGYHSDLYDYTWVGETHLARLGRLKTLPWLTNVVGQSHNSRSVVVLEKYAVVVPWEESQAYAEEQERKREEEMQAAVENTLLGLGGATVVAGLVWGLNRLLGTRR